MDRGLSTAADVVVVGGGPAGLATAIAARKSGLEVLVLERSHPPIDKACGEGIMPAGVDLLRGMGVDLEPGRAMPIRGIRFLEGEGDCVAEADFPAGCGYGLGVRRTRLHEALAARAAEVGASLRWGVRCLGLADGGVETNAGFVRARFIVGADGLLSRVRTWAGLEAAPGARRRFGVRRHLAVEPWTDFVEVHWAEDCEAYVTPTGPGEVGVAILWTGGGASGASFDQLVRSFPLLSRRLHGARPLSSDRGAGPLEQRTRAVARGYLALVGDASGYVDAITGEGLGLAFAQALALAAALSSGDLRGYVHAHRRLSRHPERLTRMLLFAERRPALRHRLIEALSRDPELFSRLLGVQGCALPLRSVGLGRAIRLTFALANKGVDPAAASRNRGEAW